MNKEEAYEKLKQDVLLFGKVCSPNTCVVRTPEFHYDLAAIWHDITRTRVNVIAPRGHGKSTLCKFFALHHLMYGPTNIKVILLISRTQSHAIRLLADIKNNLEYSQTFREIFGYWGKETASKWSEDEIILKDGSIIMCKGASQMIIGINHLSQRPTFVLYDDPEDENNTKTKESMESTLRILLRGVDPGADPIHGRIFVIGTPQREGCLVEKLKDMPEWITKHYDAIVNEKDKRVLWPEWISWERLMMKKASYEAINRLSIFYSEYRCTIIGDEDQLFNIQDFRYWDGDYKKDERGESYILIKRLGKQERDGLDWKVVWEDVVELVWKPINTFMGVDPASSTSTSADYSVIMVIGIDIDKKAYILPFFRKRVKPMDLTKNIIEYYHKYRPKITNIETTGYQEMLRDYLRQESPVYIPGLELKNNPRTPKSKRIETLQPFFYNKQMLFKSDMPNLGDLENELLLYPRTKHDDILDALYYARKTIRPPYHKHESNKTVRRVFRRFAEGWATS